MKTHPILQIFVVYFIVNDSSIYIYFIKRERERKSELSYEVLFLDLMKYYFCHVRKKK